MVAVVRLPHGNWCDVQDSRTLDSRQRLRESTSPHIDIQHACPYVGRCTLHSSLNDGDFAVLTTPGVSSDQYVLGCTPTHHGSALELVGLGALQHPAQLVQGSLLAAQQPLTLSQPHAQTSGVGLGLAGALLRSCPAGLQLSLRGLGLRVRHSRTCVGVCYGTGTGVTRETGGGVCVEEMARRDSWEWEGCGCHLASRKGQEAVHSFTREQAHTEGSLKGVEWAGAHTIRVHRGVTPQAGQPFTRPTSAASNPPNCSLS